MLAEIEPDFLIAWCHSQPDGAVGDPLIAQYGCSSYLIDCAAQHPAQRGLMVLAIECDRASYHSSAPGPQRTR